MKLIDSYLLYTGNSDIVQTVPLPCPQAAASSPPPIPSAAKA